MSGAASDERWLQLYKSYGPIIYAQCRKILGDDMAAEDAAQETFVRAFKHLERVRSVAEALPWILRIATHHCLNERRNSERRALPVEELPERPGQHAEELLGNRDFLLRLLESAPEKVRVVAWLHYMEGLEQGEVAQVLDISRRTVAYRLAELAELAARMRSERSQS